MTEVMKTGNTKNTAHLQRVKATVLQGHVQNSNSRYALRTAGSIMKKPVHPYMYVCGLPAEHLSITLCGYNIEKEISPRSVIALHRQPK